MSTPPRRDRHVQAVIDQMAYSGRVQIQIPLIPQAITGAKTHGHPANTSESAMLAPIAVSAASLALREIARRVRHWRKGGP